MGLNPGTAAKEVGPRLQAVMRDADAFLTGHRGLPVNRQARLPPRATPP